MNNNKISSSASTTPTIHETCNTNNDNDNNNNNSPTTTTTPTTTFNLRAARLASARIRHPSIIPLDYNYRTMTPSTAYSQQQHQQHQQPSRHNINATPTQLHYTRTPNVPVVKRRDVSTIESGGSSGESGNSGDGEYNSLFGDPVPPPPIVVPEMLNCPMLAAPTTPTTATAASAQQQSSPALLMLLRPNSESQSSEDDGGSGFGQTYTRLFPTTPYTRQHQYQDPQQHHHQPHHHHHHHHHSHGARDFDVMQPIPVPRLQPPDIQVLPNSSGGSASSEARPDNAPDFTLLTPQDILRKPMLYDLSDDAVDIMELTETVTINDANGAREYTEATRRVTNFAEDFKSNVGALSSTTTPVTPPRTASRQYSEDSYVSSDWFHPFARGNIDYPEFNKMPRLRPSSRNVMSIKRDELSARDSPVAALLHDAQGSSSGEEQQQLDTTLTLAHPSVSLDALTSQSSPTPPVLLPSHLPAPEPRKLHDFDRDLDREVAYVTVTPKQKRQRKSSESNFMTPPPPPQPPPIPEVTDESGIDQSEEIPKETVSEEDNEVAEMLKRERSPVILRDSIATGSDYRVDEPRLHKKTAFTIISTRSPQSSRATSTSPMQQVQASMKQQPTSTTSSSSPAKPVAKPRYHLQRKSYTAMQLKLPTLRPQPLPLPPPPAPRGSGGADDSPRPSVQFNMTGRYTPSRMPQKGILHNRDSLTSSQDTLSLQHKTPTPTHTMSPYDDNDSGMGTRVKSYEALPLITDPYRTAIPRMQRARTDLYREPAAIPPGALPRPLKPNPNPTRQQRGLLRVINGDEFMTRIPQRSHWTGSMENLTSRRPTHLTPLRTSLGVGTRRRSSSTSPERRSSTQTASDRRSSNLSSITTSDFSFHKPPIPRLTQRRKSLLPPTAHQRRRQSLAPLPQQQHPLLDGRRTPRAKIARPSPLSPIIGTPNKDSSTPVSPLHSVMSAAARSETASEANSRRNSISSSRIPVRNGNASSYASVLEARLGSRANSPLKEFAAQLPLSSGPTSRATSSHTHSQANSRAPSRSTSRASTRPVSRGAAAVAAASSRSTSRPSSRMEQARDIANSRANARMQRTNRPGSASPQPGRRRVDTQMPSRRQSISLSPRAMRRSGSRLHLSRDAHAAATAAATAVVQRQEQQRRIGRSKTPVLERRLSQSRIPTRARSASRSSPKPEKVRTPSPHKGSTAASPMAITARKKQMQSKTTTPKHATPTARKSTAKPATSAKKATPTSARKAESSVKRLPSSVAKQSAAVKKQPADLQRSGSNLKRETSNLQRLGTAGGNVKPVKREVSSLSMKKAATSTSGGARKRSDKKTPAKAAASKSADKAKATASAVATAAVAGAAAAAAGAGRVGTSGGSATDSSAADNEKPSTSASSTDGIAMAAGDAGSGGSGSGGGGVAVLKRQASNLSLLRMGSKLSLLSKKRSDSSLSKRGIAEQPMAEAQQTAAGSADGEALSSQEMSTLPTAILEKSQKTLETIQKTVTVATDEIQKTIIENLTDLKSLEQDMGKISDSAASPTSSVATVVENRAAAATTAKPQPPASDAAAAAEQQSQSQPTTVTSAGMQPIEAAVAVANAGAAETTTTSVLPDVECESANLQNYTLNVAAGGGGGIGGDGSGGVGPGGVDAITATNAIAGGDEATNKRRSPDGEGGPTLDTGADKADSREFLEAKGDGAADDVDSGSTATARSSCCSCCARFCMPCRRARCSQCCQRRSQRHSGDADEARRPVLSATSSATTTHLEIIDERQNQLQQQQQQQQKQKLSCWQRLNCCQRCRSKQQTPAVAEEEQQQAVTMATTTTTAPASDAAPRSKQSKCGLCLSKVFCCRSVNKVEAITGVETEVKKCCFCIPCRRRRQQQQHSAASASRAWHDDSDVEAAAAEQRSEAALEAARPNADRPGCCKRLWRCLCCCCCARQTAAAATQSRRESIKVPPPPAEDTRRKLHVDLVEYTSKMKGAIPVLPLYLAWFCMACNIVVPGLGTIFSGLFCLCVGIPRFSQYDSAKARIGSFIINIIVGVSQFFCVLFCCVGWGWSIWWGTIMLKCARKLSKIKKVERLEMEEERRQAEAAAAVDAAAARVAHTTGAELEVASTIAAAGDMAASVATTAAATATTAALTTTATSAAATAATTAAATTTAKA